MTELNTLYFFIISQRERQDVYVVRGCCEFHAQLNVNGKIRQDMVEDEEPLEAKLVNEIPLDEFVNILRIGQKIPAFKIVESKIQDETNQLVAQIIQNKDWSLYVQNANRFTEPTKTMLREELVRFF